MELVVWNSRGNKWDAFWTNALGPLHGPGGLVPDDVVGLLVESGWPPWMKSRNVEVTNIYKLDSTMDYYKASTDAFTAGVEGNRRASAWWCPWGKKVAKDGTERTNTRCSMGIVHVRKSLSTNVTKHKINGFMRPVIRVSLARDGLTKLSIVLVHLVSSNGARWEVATLLSNLSRLIPQGVPGFIVGDLNINLLQGNPCPQDDRWQLVNTGQATQSSGGELDYGLLYHSNGSFIQAQVALVKGFQTDWNNSDHSVLQYTLGIA